MAQRLHFEIRHNRIGAAFTACCVFAASVPLTVPNSVSLNTAKPAWLKPTPTEPRLSPSYLPNKVRPPGLLAAAPPA